jgi:uncharacterized protein YihD (DUF1040 family)
MKPTDGTR